MPPTSRSRLRRALRVLGIGVALLVVFLLSLVRSDIPQTEIAAKYGGPTSKFATIEGMSVHYRDEGSGPPLVLIHGSSSSLHTWDGWVTRLSARRRIVRLDLPGYGLTGPAPDRIYSAARCARVVVALLDRLAIDRADVAGNSFGGRIAATIALEHPTRVSHLVLVDAAGLSGQKPPAIFAMARTPVVGRLLRWVTPRFLVRKNVVEVYADPSLVTDALVDRYYELTRREGNRQATLDRFTAPADPSLDDRLGEIRVPVLIEWGERDPWIPLPFAQRWMDGVRGSKLVTYANAGHVPMEEIPEVTARDAEAFLSAPE